MKCYLKYMNPEFEFNWHHDLLIKKLEAVERGDIKRLIISVPPRHGKLLAHDTLVPTTRGWKSHGNLQVGDYVFNLAGNPTRVTHVHPESVADVEVTFSNGQKVVCNGEHLWVLYDRLHRKERTLSTEYITTQKLRNGDHFRFGLPNREAIFCGEKELPVDPYVLGAWLGDGRSDDPVLCYPEFDRCVFDEVVRRIGHPSWTTVHKDTKVNYAGFKQLRPGLKMAGLLKHKHIPRIYQRASVAQRLELLAGLIDTDGHMDTQGRVRIVNTNKEIIKGVYELATGLGFRPYIMKTTAEQTNSYNRNSAYEIVSRQDVYTVGFNPDLPLPVVVERKNPNSFHNVKRRITLVSIRKVVPKPGKCITVEDPNGVYLVGKTMIPTHNSYLVSKWFPTWYLGKNPTKEIIQASYNQDFVIDIGRFVKNVIKDNPKYKHIFPYVDVASDSKANDKFSIKGTDGNYFAVGVGGPTTGRGCDIGIIDDPLKNAEDANSPTIREKLWDWYQSTLYTRLMPGARLIVIMTRWHSDDLAGRILANDTNNLWEVVELPAIDKDGKALWPSRYNEETLAEIKQTIGPRQWSALYMQKPIISEGAIIQESWFKYYSTLPPILEYYWSVDTASKEGQENDYSVAQLWGKAHNGYYLIKQIRGRWRYTVLRSKLDALFTETPATECLIEDTSAGIQIIQEFKEYADFPVIAMKPGRNMPKDKVERLEFAATHFEAGNIFFPEKEDWVHDLKAELVGFPYWANDDQVDACAMAIFRMTKKKKKRIFDSNIVPISVGESLKYMK